ncbi:MAG: hypothetical protein KC543_03545 [Myxococcales bacterium]|nr:hypothetical protein [Myxococcales bacterium]
MPVQLAFDYGDAAPGGDVGAPKIVRSVAPRAEPMEAARERAGSLSAGLAEALGQRVRLHVTDNRRVMLSASRRSGHLEVRLHHMFLDADAALVKALARYLSRGDRRAGEAIDAFIAAQSHKIDRRAPRRLHAAGDVHDLQRILDRLAARHFGGVFGAQITWARRTRPGRSRRQSIRLGTYVAEERLIRVHPVLDQRWVPEFYVESVVFHEMLHHDMPAEVHRGRRRLHTAEFRARERCYERFAEAERWERAHLHRLLASE